MTRAEEDWAQSAEKTLCIAREEWAPAFVGKR